MDDVPDASVWLPLSAPDHVHHARAMRYWRQEAAPRVRFCRVTHLALLRHLTNRKIMRHAVLSGRAAFDVFDQWMALPEVAVLAEPGRVDAVLRHWSRTLPLEEGLWTDACLAALAVATGTRLVAFDNDFARFPGLQFLLIEDDPAPPLRPPDP